MERNEAIHQAARAKAILEDEMVQKAFADLEGAIVEQWMELSVSNKEQAEELKRLLWASKQFRTIFTTLIAGGTIAQNELLLEQNMQFKKEAALERIRAYG